MRQMAPFGKAHRQHGITRLQESLIDRLIGLRARVCLHVSSLGPEQCFQALNGQLFNHINILATTVVTFAGIAFGIFVGHLRALCLHHSRTGVVFRRNQLNMVFLALILFLDGCPNFSVNTVEG